MNGPLIVQSDRTVLLEVAHPDAEEARHELAIFAALLFLPAGTLAWPGAWVFLAVMAAASVWGLSWLGRHDPELLAERLRPPFQRDQPRSDKLLMGAFMPLWFGWYVLMAFDRRFGWSDVPVALQVLGAALICLGLWLSWTVLKENSYAAPVVIQAEGERRCLVPFTQFAEPKSGKDKHGRPAQYWFTVTDQPIAAFAGLWRPTEAGPVFAFCTTEPNALIAPLHPKAMPVVLGEAEQDVWLTGSADEALGLVASYPSQLMAVG